MDFLIGAKSKRRAGITLAIVVVVATNVFGNVTATSLPFTFSKNNSENYHGPGLCCLPKPKAEADNTNHYFRGLAKKSIFNSVH